MIHRAVRAAAPAAAVLLLAAVPALAQGCALCRRNLEQNGGAGLLEGFYWSILLLVGTPILLAGGFVLMVLRASRRARKEEAAGPGG